eukprot:scaffold24149_cov168-Skeletonema_marinoi.AAC.1
MHITTNPNSTIIIPFLYSLAFNFQALNSAVDITGGRYLHVKIYLLTDLLLALGVIFERASHGAGERDLLSSLQSLTHAVTFLAPLLPMHCACNNLQ